MNGHSINFYFHSTSIADDHARCALLTDKRSQKWPQSTNRIPERAPVCSVSEFCDILVLRSGRNRAQNTGTMDHPHDQQNQLETHSLNPVPNRRAINDLHFNAINTNYKNQNKLNNNNVVVQNDDSKVLLLPSNHRKFIIVPSQPGSAISSSGGTASPPPTSPTQPTGCSNNNNNTNTCSHTSPHVAKFEIGESSSSGPPSSMLNPAYPLGPSSKPKQFHSLRSVRSGR